MKRYIFTSLALMAALGTSSPANDFYPLAVGHTWMYEGIRIDSLGPIPGTEYTLVRDIPGTEMISGQTWFVQMDSSDTSGVYSLDTSYVRTVGDTVKYLVPLEISDTTEVVFREADIAILPGAVGQTWEVLRLDTFFVDMGDTVEVSFRWSGEQLPPETVTVPAGTFNNARHILTTDSIITSFGFFNFVTVIISEAWVAQNVGVVLSTSPGHGSFVFFVNGYIEELTNYNLPVEPSSLPQRPETFELAPPYPNPFNPRTTASYTLNAPGHVRLKIYDPAGEEITTLVDGWKPAGSYQAGFDGLGLAAGVYLLRMEAGGYSHTQKLVLLK
ncbi:MAG: T9SS C-terminal target domain-containing protein [Candidatus Zixiibacteriota bacterium]|nr:MAG: T9SS C-terminal target domain-containing protein [candidate division Zixibacteria bacterium]